MPNVLRIINRGMMRMDVFLMLVGALIGWGIAHFYYVKTLNDMRAEAEEKERIDDLLLRGIESIGTIKYSRDASGKITGVSIELRGGAEASSSALGELTVGSPASGK